MVSKKAIVLDYKICIGLYAYLRQLEMSLDRALPLDIQGIKDYFLSPRIYKISHVADFFEGLLPPKKSILFKDNSSDSIYNSILGRNTFKISWDEMMILVLCLRRVHEIINQEELNVESFINMRMLLPKVGWNLLGRKLPRRYIAKTYLVEFYNHSSNSSFKSIDEIIGNRWIV